MKIYILVEVTYDYHRWENNIDVDTNLDTLKKRTPDNIEILTQAENDKLQDVKMDPECHYIQTWEGGKLLT